MRVAIDQPRQQRGAAEITSAPSGTLPLASALLIRPFSITTVRHEPALMTEWRNDMTVEGLKKDPTMTHLLESLEQGEHIGHYGRLVFALVARHFLSPDELTEWLAKDRNYPSANAS